MSVSFHYVIWLTALASILACTQSDSIPLLSSSWLNIAVEFQDKEQFQLTEFQQQLKAIIDTTEELLQCLDDLHDWVEVFGSTEAKLKIEQLQIVPKYVEVLQRFIYKHPKSLVASHFFRLATCGSPWCEYQGSISFKFRNGNAVFPKFVIKFSPFPFTEAHLQLSDTPSLGVQFRLPGTKIHAGIQAKYDHGEGTVEMEASAHLSKYANAYFSSKADCEKIQLTFEAKLIFMEVYREFALANPLCQLQLPYLN
ncbi:uncharacterized protein LOC106180008 [Lingula anatina]|uniref:Uncharacterized protein LOC106180008 n=1 Tax=Lingula anatina TaxID=7574 RepID=A0A1S3K9L6_LINAN|nr:uncharacterized protein LOC106180008 [Lingula anatina]|eukprot:XP_013419323.1 uncharacterized protein LOC106180008 [Lingula anatina]